MDTNNKKNEKYGEFIPSYFAWISLDGQKKRAKELDEATRKKKRD